MSMAHLHNHTSHSILDGLQKLAPMIDAALADNNPALAITDHGTSSGHYSFYSECRKKGIKPILGIEAYIVADRFAQADAEQAKRYQHLTMLAATPKGWNNLITLSNKSHEGDSFKYKPRMSMDMFREHASRGQTDGIIVGTGCLGGPVAGPLMRDNPEQAELALRQLIEYFGTDGVFVEIMDHGIEAERKVIPPLVALAAKYGLPVVATNDAHYTHKDDAYAHDVWLCVSQKRGAKTVSIDDPDRFRFDGTGYHLRTAQEMHDIFDGEPGTSSAVANTLLIAERIDDDVIGETRTRLPRFEAPTRGMYTLGSRTVEVVLDNPTPGTLLRQLIREGAALRYGPDWQTSRIDVVRRLKREFSVIEHFGYEDYFLLVFDAIAWARSTRSVTGVEGVKKPILVGPGRGSAAGSLVAYCLWITNIEPLSNNLLFERFLDPSRLDFPDIDTDFEAGRRDEVITYLQHKYGRDSVAKLGTFGVAWAKRATKDVGRVTGQTELSIAVSKAIQVKGVAESSSFNHLLSPHNQLGIPLREMIDRNEDARALVELARKVEGVIAGESIHACGVVVGDEPLNTLIPLRMDRRKAADTSYVTEWDADDISKFGLVKLDLLFINDLDVVAGALRIIHERSGENIDVDNLPLGGGTYANGVPNVTADIIARDNARVAKTWDLLAHGKTAGVFQLAAGGITTLTSNVRPESLHDIAAIVALYRPGPMGSGEHEKFARRKRGGEEVTYDQWTRIPEEQAVLKEVLDKSLACLMFQEDLMILARSVADFDDSEVNRLRKAFSKKIRSEMDALYSRFLTGGASATRADGTPKVPFQKDTLVSLWVTFQASAEYLFNASHAYAYGYISYMTAYLKANWPAAYGAALLAATDNEDKRAAMLAALKAEGIEVLPPSVNKGSYDTTVDDDGNVRIGMGAVAGAGNNTQYIERERRVRGPFSSLHDLMTRVKLPDASGNENVLARKLPVQTVEALIDAGALDEFGPRLGLRMVARAASVFDVAVPDVEYGPVERTTREIGLLGILLSDSPLTRIGLQLKQWREPDARNGSAISVGQVPHAEGAHVLVIGQVRRVREKTINSGVMVEFVLMSAKSEIECVMWPSSVRKYGAPVVGSIVGVTAVTRFASQMTSGEEVAENGTLTLSVSKVWQGALDDPATNNIAVPAQPQVAAPVAHEGAPVAVELPLRRSAKTFLAALPTAYGVAAVLTMVFPGLEDHLTPLDEWLRSEDTEPYPVSFTSRNGAREVTFTKAAKNNAQLTKDVLQASR